MIDVADPPNALKERVALLFGKRVAGFLGGTDTGVALLQRDHLQNDHRATLGSFGEHLGSGASSDPESKCGHKGSSHELPIIHEPFHFFCLRKTTAMPNWQFYYYTTNIYKVNCALSQTVLDPLLFTLIF